MKIPFMKQVAACLVVTVFMLGLVPIANADMVTSSMTMDSAERGADLETVRKALERELVKQRLSDYGFTEKEVSERLDLLSDKEIHQLALKADEVHVGGDGLLVAVLILAVVALVYLIAANKHVVIEDR